VLGGAAANAQVQRDGSLQVSEEITIGDVYHGAYRDIPLRKGESIDDIGVSENGQRYTQGGSAELGSIDTPGTFATTQVGSTKRIVWHFDNPSGG
jgi:hypothetical protein